MVSKLAAGAAALLAVAALPQGLSAHAFERAPSFRIENIAGFWPSGDNYTINNPVLSDGLLRIYALNTPHGEFIVHGDHMLRMRVNELRGLHELEKIANSESYGKALLEAGLSPLKYTGRLITDPKKTVGDTFSGISTMFGRFSADLNNIGKTPGDAFSGLLGVTDQRRKLATKVGVDPYTDFPPLDAKLNQLAQAAAAGGLTVQAAMFAVPVTTIGIVYSNLGTASSVEGVRIDEIARDQTASQIFDLNREKLHKMGGDIDLVEALLVNRNYTPIDMTVLTAALDGMPEVEDRVVFLQRAVTIDSRSLAYFMRRHAEMLKNQQSRGAGFSRFVLLGGYPFNLARNGRIVGAMPIDILAWTEKTAAVWHDCAADARRIAPGARVELRITGKATPLARRELQTLGFRVVENTKF
jgi:hypothetical protein